MDTRTKLWPDCRNLATFHEDSASASATGEGIIRGSRITNSLNNSIPLPARLAFREHTFSSDKQGGSEDAGEFRHSLNTVTGQNAILTAPKQPGPRKRGRPSKQRKSHSPITPTSSKRRTRSGCLICRRRKKKCDEKRPVCGDCQRNNYICQYPEKTVYAIEKSVIVQGAKTSTFDQKLPSFLTGVDTDVDRRLLNHFIHHVSPRLSLNTDGRNLYLIYIFPMAVENGALMHGLLALSASYVLFQESPWNHEELTKHRLRLHISSVRGMRQVLENHQHHIDELAISVNLVLLLYALIEGRSDDKFHQHMAAAKTMLSMCRILNNELYDFVYENFQRLACLCTLVSTMAEDYSLIPSGISQRPRPQLLIVFGNFLPVLMKISCLRRKVHDQIRRDIYAETSFLLEAASIAEELRQWTAPFEYNSTKWIASQIFHRAAWVYLWRIFRATGADGEMDTFVEESLDLYDRIPCNDSVHCCLLPVIFLLGIAASALNLRNRISDAFNHLEHYSGLRNITETKRIVQVIWNNMNETIFAIRALEDIIAGVAPELPIA